MQMTIRIINLNKLNEIKTKIENSKGKFISFEMKVGDKVTKGTTRFNKERSMFRGVTKWSENNPTIVDLVEVSTSNLIPVSLTDLTSMKINGEQLIQD